MEQDNRFYERKAFDGKTYNSPIYKMQKEEFEYYEHIYNFERKAFWKGFCAASTIGIIAFLIAIIV